MPFSSWVPFGMNLCHLIRKPGAMSLEGRRLSWVLKLWYLEKAYIPPTIPKIKKVLAFFEKMVAQKASQTLISMPPFSLWQPLETVTVLQGCILFKINFLPQSDPTTVHFSPFPFFFTLYVTLKFTLEVRQMMPPLFGPTIFFYPKLVWTQNVLENGVWLWCWPNLFLFILVKSRL